MVNFTNFDAIARPTQVEEFAFEHPSDMHTLQMLPTPGFGFPSPTLSGILLHGTYGAGKSTLAKLLPSTFEVDFKPYELSPWCEEIVVASGNNGVNIFEKLQGLSNKAPWGQKFCYAILHEVDCLTATAMSQLKGIMDDSNGRVVYIFSTNHLTKIDQGIRSRCYEIGFDFVQPDAWVPSVERVLNAYGITHYTQQQMLNIAYSLNGSGRDFAKNLKNEIGSYYAQYPHLLPAHLK